MMVTSKFVRLGRPMIITYCVFQATTILLGVIFYYNSQYNIIVFVVVQPTTFAHK